MSIENAEKPESASHSELPSWVSIMKAWVRRSSQLLMEPSVEEALDIVIVGPVDDDDDPLLEPEPVCSERITRKLVGNGLLSQLSRSGIVLMCFAAKSKVTGVYCSSNAQLG